MKEIEYKGAKVYYLANAGNKFHSFVGAETALEAIWAKLNDANVRRTGWTGIGVSLESNVKYRRMRMRLKCGLMQMIVVHPAFAATNVDEEILFVSPEPLTEPPPEFFPLLNLKLRIPILKAWETELWKKGLSQRDRYTDLIATDTGEGIIVYTVHTALTDGWTKVVKEILTDGKTSR